MGNISWTYSNMLHLLHVLIINIISAGLNHKKEKRVSDKPLFEQFVFVYLSPYANSKDLKLEFLPHLCAQIVFI